MDKSDDTNKLYLAHQEWNCPLTGMIFLWIPGGLFRMGALSGGSDERPVHEVELDGFWLGKYPVTQKEWSKVMRRTPSQYKKGDNYPVGNISWNDVQEYIGALNMRSNEHYRLPTEAEWECACRSGGKRERYSGGDNVDRVAWYSANSHGSTHPVGQKDPNGLGLYDMSGNVWEWVSDWYSETYYAHSPRKNPQGPATGPYKVKRGGCCHSYPTYARSASRFGPGPGYRYNFLGFRLARNDKNIL